MTTDEQQLAARLLDAQVAHMTAELTGPGAAAVVGGETEALLDAVEGVLVRDLLELTAVQTTARTVLAHVARSSAVTAMVAELVPRLRDLPANDDQRLGDLVDRDGVGAIVDALAASSTLREEVLRRLSSSPAVSTLALRFVSALVGDAVQQNRERAEKVPGMKSLLGVGDFAARQARGMAPKQLERVVGGAADKGAQAAMDRVSRALVDTFDERAVRTAAMELWDLHADEPVAGLRGYLTDDEVEQVATSAHEASVGLHTSAWQSAVADAAVEAFLDHYGDLTVGQLLVDLDLDREVLVTAAVRHAPRVLATLHADGHVEAALRRRLAPFYESPEAQAILADG